MVLYQSLSHINIQPLNLFRSDQRDLITVYSFSDANQLELEELSLPKTTQKEIDRPVL